MWFAISFLTEHTCPIVTETDERLNVFTIRSYVLK